MRESEDLVRITGLWKRTSRRGLEYLVGALGSARLVILPNRNRRTEQDPELVLFLAPKRQGRSEDAEGGERRTVPVDDSWG